MNRPLTVAVAGCGSRGQDTYARILREFDDNGNTIHAVYFDGQGNPIACRSGYDEIRQAFNDRNQVVRIEYFLNGAPVLLAKGYSSLTREYDENGTVINETYFGLYGEPVQ